MAPAKKDLIDHITEITGTKHMLVKTVIEQSFD